VHVGFFRGGADGGTNALRRHIFEHVCPAYDGKPALPIVSYDHWFGIDNKLNLDLMKKQARRAAELHVDTFVVDAAWFPGDFPLGVGNWHSVNEAKFPGGLEVLNEYVKGLGMGLGLWFEPERAVEGTEAVVRHPEFFVEAPSWGGKPFFHINLARRDAQDYLIETVGGWIRRLDLRWSRWDYNIDPHEPWQKLDPTGKIQFAYMRGLYRVLDTLIRDNPRWMVEQCASGGRRLDLGTMKRGHTCWFSDQTDDPLLCRYMQARANRFMPGNYCNSSVAVGWQAGDKGFDDTAVLSRMLGKLAFDGDIASWSAKLTRRMARWSAEFKALRHLMVQDFYQLLPMPTTIDDWDALQFAARDGSEAALFVFAGAEGAAAVKPRGLTPGAVYEVSQRPAGRSVRRAAEPLTRKGLTVKLGRLQSGLWTLKRAI
jgi:alpha-galactosidase